jgi:hypothetical protein
MKKYGIFALFSTRVLVAEYEAESADQAIEMADNDKNIPYTIQADTGYPFGNLELTSDGDFDVKEAPYHDTTKKKHL